MIISGKDCISIIRYNVYRTFVINGSSVTLSDTVIAKYCICYSCCAGVINGSAVISNVACKRRICYRNYTFIVNGPVISISSIITKKRACYGYCTELSVSITVEEELLKPFVPSDPTLFMLKVPYTTSR